MSNLQGYNAQANIVVEGNNGVYEFGQYYRYTPTSVEKSTYFTEGEIYIVCGLGIHHISQNVHNVSLFIPQHARNSSSDTIRLNIKELEANFTFVPADKAEEERQKLLSNFEQQANRIREDLQLALKSPQATFEKALKSNNAAVMEAMEKIDTSIPALPSPDVMNSNSHSVVATTNGKSVDIVRRQLQNQRQLGEVVTVYAREKNSELSDVVQNVASIKMEEASAIKGQAASMMQSVGDVESKIEQLTLYLGDNVAIHTVNKGPESTSKAKIDFFSCMIYLDEEMLTENIFSEGEFDHRNVESFFERLNDTPSFRNRILPTERCVVVARPRRKAKIYTECPFTNRLLNIGNFDSFLLIRDGERVSAIYSAINYQTRMFPTQKEMDDFFSGVFDVDDVKLTDAQRQMKLVNDMYMKVAAILQGIVDRQESGGTVVFGELPAPQHSASFFDPNLINSNVNFINDEDNLITANTAVQNPHAWISKHRASELFENDLIFATRDLICFSNIPQAYYQDVNHIHKPELRWDLNEHEMSEIKQVSTYKGKIGIKLEMRNTHWGAQEDKVRKMNCGLKEHENPLNMRHIKLSELNAIIASRVARPVIQSNFLMPELLEARTQIATLMGLYKELIEKIQTVAPQIDEESAYLAALNFTLNSGGKFDEPVKPTTKNLNNIIKLHNSLVTIDESAAKRCKKFADNNDETAVLLANDGSYTYLVTNNESNVSSMPITNEIGKKLMDVQKMLGLKRYLVTPDAITPLGWLTHNDAKTLRNEYFYPLSEDDAQSLTVHGLEPHYTRHYTPRNAMNHCYNGSPKLTEIVQNGAIAIEQDKAIFADIKAKQTFIQSALAGTDLDKLNAFQTLINEITAPSWEAAINNVAEKTEQVTKPRIAATCALNLFEHEVNSWTRNVFATAKPVYVVFDYLNALNTICNSMSSKTEQSNVRQTLEQTLSNFFYYEKNYAKENTQVKTDCDPIYVHRPVKDTDGIYFLLPNELTKLEGRTIQEFGL